MPRPMRLDPPTYDRESIARAKQFQHAERLKAAREMGIPSWLIDLYEVHGFDQVNTWVALINALRRD